ncbi:hypothetical protein F0562_007432 [Nyssa sinensis]|uniref:Uncharacterized protein n=1 Tax=Nyssa sinensis TaxID=561372 RepID=A0A5J5A875_9ASTE|nr:hypothetical protein F0562_007432 [Nyssa sinensis]
MKRASLNFHQSQAVEEEARAKLKHQTLLQEFLELQKEFVAKKRKLQAEKKNRETLFAEVRFLRQRRRYLLKIKAPALEVEKDYVQLQNSAIKRKVLERGRDWSDGEVALGNPYPVLASSLNLRDEEEGGGREELVRGPLRIEKHKNYLIDEKKLGKKKISWQDQLVFQDSVSKAICDILSCKARLGLSGIGHNSAVLLEAIPMFLANPAAEQLFIIPDQPVLDCVEKNCLLLASRRVEEERSI